MVADTDAEAKKLYEKHGFTLYHARQGYYQNPPDDAHLYTLDLTPPAA